MTAALSAADLTQLRADAFADNAARVQAVADAAAALTDDVPVVLLPVRLETRFDAIEEPVATAPASLADLTAALTDAARALGRVAASDLSTSRPPGLTSAAFAKLKREVETPAIELALTRLAAAGAALDRAGALMRDPLDGDAAARTAVTGAADAVRDGLDRARAAIAAVRSDFQRGRLADRLDALAAHAQAALADVEDRQLPASRLRAALAAPGAADEAARLDLAARRRLADPRRAPAVTPASVVRGTPGDVTGLGGPTAVLAHADLARGAQTYEQVLAGLRAAGDDAAAVAALAAQATTIPLLPGAYKRELLAAADTATARWPSVDAAALRDSLLAIRSDDPALDATVARPDLVVTLAPATRRVDRLLVRIYPDDLVVDTHEEALTETELDAGATFWAQTAAAGEDEAARRAAWRALCAGRSPRRAAWIARLCEPPRAKPTPGAVAAEPVLAALATLAKRVTEVAGRGPFAPDAVAADDALAARVDSVATAAEGVARALARIRPLPAGAIEDARDRARVARAAAERLDAAAERALGKRPARDPVATAVNRARTRLRRALDTIDDRLGRVRVEPPPPERPPDLGALKDGPWTRAARAGTLPERFLVVAVADDGTVAHAVAGTTVPADLKLSIDPDPQAASAETFAVGPDGELTAGESIRWMIDYDEAVAKGMAITVPITAEQAAGGFARLYVVGLRAEDAAAGADRLETLLDNHHYGPTGLELLAPGTATNAAEGAAPGFSSRDDPDAAYDVERAAPLLDPAAVPAEPAAAPDGLRLARALGVDAATLAHVAGAGGRTGAEAQAVAAALYPATVGGWLEEHAAGLVGTDSRDRLAAFALAHVCGAGLVPALRTGAQPYGVLPTTALLDFAPAPVEALGRGASVVDQAVQQRFDGLLAGALREMRADWAALADGVKTATDPDVADPRAHFLELLGLEPVSVESSYRFAVNVAGRQSIGGLDPSLSFGVPPTNPGDAAPGSAFGPIAFLLRFEALLREAFAVDPASPVLDHGNVHGDWWPVANRLVSARAFELRHLRTAHRAGETIAGADGAADLPALVAAAPAALAAEAAARERGRPLLHLLARQALLAFQCDAALRILVAEGYLTEEARTEAGSSEHFTASTLTTSWTLTRWSYLLAPLGDLDGLQGIVFDRGPGSLLAHLDDGAASLGERLLAPGPGGVAAFAGGRHAALVDAVRRHATGVAALGAIDPERLAPLVMGHLDTASHRLDAWVTGLAHRRLQALRETTPRGAHVGAYGWVEDLRPDPPAPPAENVPAALDGDPSRPVHRDPARQGFVQAPSVNHAVTAAILRSGYLSGGEEADVANRMAVNLSSRRTRLALGLIEGVRAGNRLGALLGYRLERALHESFAGTGVTLDDMIGPLRRAFPSAAGVDEGLSADVAARQVCDGLAIVDAAQRWVADHAGPDAASRTLFDLLAAGGTFAGHPWGFAAGVLPPPSQRARLEGVLRAIDQAADALDAVGDLVVAEAVHQIAVGNHARAAAAVSALAEGQAPPPPEVVDTPRSGTPVTHRVLLCLPEPGDAGADPGWTAVPATPRALAEPVVDAWAAALLGPPGDLRVALVDASDGADAGEVSALDLGLRAIDLVTLVGPGLEQGLPELAARALHAAAPASFTDAAPPPLLQVSVGRRAAWGPQVRGIADVAPLLEAIGGLLGRARAATASDLVLAEPGLPVPGGAAPAGPADGLDRADLGARVGAARAGLAAAGVALARLLSDDATLDEAVLAGDPHAFLDAHAAVGPPLWSARETWRAALLRAAAFGLPAAIPPTQQRTRDEVREGLRAAAQTTFTEIAGRVVDADGLLAGDGAPGALLEAAEALLGPGVPLLARVAPRNRPELDTALAARLASPAELTGWLHGAAAVREGSRALADLLALADAGGAPVPDGAVTQLPVVADDAWAGGPLPAGAARAGRLSLVLHGAGALPADGATGVVLHVDEWTELVPNGEETTGVALYHDQPDASPPQCVLVAVPPRRRGRWRLGDVVQILHETFELARIRAVELDHVQATLYGQLLPLVSGELVPDAAGGAGGVAGNRVILDFGATR